MKSIKTKIQTRRETDLIMLQNLNDKIQAAVYKPFIKEGFYIKYVSYEYKQVSKYGSK